MKRRLIAVGVLAAAAAALVAHACVGNRLVTAAQAQYGGTPVNVNVSAARCILGDSMRFTFALVLNRALWTSSTSTATARSTRARRARA